MKRSGYIIGTVAILGGGFEALVGFTADKTELMVMGSTGLALGIAVFSLARTL